MKSQKVKKQITFSKKMVQLVERKANIIGLDFPEFVRYVITKEVENDAFNEIPNVQTRKSILDSLANKNDLIDQSEFDRLVRISDEEKD